MHHVVNMPKVGDTVNEVLVLEWLAAVGDLIAVDDPLVLVETDKAEIEVPSPVAGTLAETSVSVDEEVPTGAPICVIES